MSDATVMTEHPEPRAVPIMKPSGRGAAVMAEQQADE